MSHYFDDALREVIQFSPAFSVLQETEVFNPKEHHKVLRAYKRLSRKLMKEIQLEPKMIARQLEDATILKLVSTYQIPKEFEYLQLCFIAVALLRQVAEFEDAEKARNILYEHLETILKREVSPQPVSR